MSNPVFWSNTLDGTYRCYVQLETDTCGYLRMERLDTNERVLDRLVPVSKYFRHQDIYWWGRECLRKAAALG